MTTLARAQWKAMLKDTVLKELRSKTLIFIFIASTFMIILAHMVLKWFMKNNDANIIIQGQDSLTFMFIIINFWSVIIAGIFGINTIRSDFKNNIIYQYLTFPISRTQYMWSRIIGSWLIVYGYYLYSYLLSAVLFSVATQTLALHWTHVISMLLMGLYVFMIIVLSIPFSLIAGKIGAFLLLLFSVFIIQVSNSSLRLEAVADYFKELSFFKIIGMLVYFFLPRINYVSEVSSAVMNKEPIKLNLGLEALHLVATTALIIYGINYFIKKKNF